MSGEYSSGTTRHQFKLAAELQMEKFAREEAALRRDERIERAQALRIPVDAAMRFGSVARGWHRP